MLKEKTCINCNSEFIPSRRDLKYCSPECRNSYYYYSRKTNKTTQNNSPSNNIEERLSFISNIPESQEYIPESQEYNFIESSNINLSNEICQKLAEFTSEGLNDEDKKQYQEIFIKQSNDLCKSVNLDSIIIRTIDKYTNADISPETALLGLGASMVYLSYSIRKSLKQQKKEV